MDYSQKPISDKLEHLVAKSGEVFYLKDGKLLSCKDTTEFASIVAQYVLRQRADNHYNQYFSVYIQAEEMTYKAPIRNKSYITTAIRKLPLDEMNKAFAQYVNLMINADKEIVELQGEYVR